MVAPRGFQLLENSSDRVGNKTVGIVGFGRIGRRVGEIAAVMGMRVVASDEARENAPAGPDLNGAN